jgi:hypothetical protein
LIHAGDIKAAHFHDINMDGVDYNFAPGAGCQRGLWLDNTHDWTERNVFTNVNIANCAKVVDLTGCGYAGGAHCSASTGYSTGGTDSFEYNTFDGMYLYSAVAGDQLWAVEDGATFTHSAVTGVSFNTSITAGSVLGLDLYPAGSVSAAAQSLENNWAVSGESNGTGGMVQISTGIGTQLRMNGYINVTGNHVTNSMGSGVAVNAPFYGSQTPSDLYLESSLVAYPSITIPSTTGTISAGSQTLTVVSGATFKNGAGVTIAGAGAAGVQLNTVISSGGGTNTWTLADKAVTSVTGAVVGGPTTAGSINSGSHTLTLSRTGNFQTTE